MDLTFGQLIRSYMERRGVKPRDLAHAINRSESYVSLLTNDRVKTPPPDVLRQLSETLKVSEFQLLKKLGYLTSSSATPARPQADARLDELFKVAQGMTEDEFRWLLAYADFLIEQRR